MGFRYRTKRRNRTSEDSESDYSENRHFDIIMSNNNNNNKMPRLVKKCGELNINMNNVPKHKRRLLGDLFNTILDIKWRWHFIIFLLSFMLSWLFFACTWYFIAYIHDDLNSKDALFEGTNAPNGTKEESPPCISGVHDFTSALLYSIETQHTIGYGYRHITTECPLAIFILMIQSCVGIFVQGLVAGVAFAKLSRPSKRKRTIIFSDYACISERDNQLCFQFKIGNIRISQLSDASVRLIMIKSRRTKEGEFIPFQTYQMKVGNEMYGNDCIFFPWPKVVEHIIDENSPFHDIYVQLSNGKNVFEEIHYEIVVILEGNIESTGASCHIRTSYIASEILWGYKFIPVYPLINNSGYSLDFTKFNQVEPTSPHLLGLNRHVPGCVINLKTTNSNFNCFSTNENSCFRTERSLSSLGSHNVDDCEKVQDCGVQTASTNDCVDFKETNETNKIKRNGRFTIVPVNGGQFVLAQSLSMTSILQLDEGYLTCGAKSSTNTEDTHSFME